MKFIDIQNNTIIMLVGPSNSGKSFFAKNVLQSFLDKEGIHNKYLSSDALRRDLLGNNNLHKHNKKMHIASKGAFDILHNNLDVYTTYPINIPVVIVDTTFLTNIARNQIIEIAKKNGYNLTALVFDYTDNNDYFKYVDEDTDKRVIMEMIRTLKMQTVKNMDKRDYQSIHRIDTIDFSNIVFTYTQNKDGINIDADDFCVVGDIHGCYDEFITMLNDNKGYIVNSEAMTMTPKEGETHVHHVLVGDVIDKGPHSDKMIRFLLKNKHHFTMVRGNHERWVWQYISGQIKKDEQTIGLIENYFDTIKLLEADTELKQDFLELYKYMYAYAYNDKCFVTHAPCQVKHLGKSDKVSIKAMNTIMYPKRKDYDSEDLYLQAKEDFFSFLLKEAQINQPAHIFGHVPLDRVFSNKNKWAIDTGCYAGGWLSTLLFRKDGYKPFVQKYKSQQKQTETFMPLFRVRANEVDILSLEPELATRLRWCAKNQINFVSGTMSPTNKSEEDLESLQAGIDYFRKVGVKEIVLQPKFMGSRCNVLLHITDITKCKAISRNAYTINNERLNSPDKTLETLFEELQQKYKTLFEENKAEYILFDGELLPWNAMGKELIERDFVLAAKAAESEIKIFEEIGFYDAMKAYANKYADPTAEILDHEKSMLKAYNAFKDEFLTEDEYKFVLERYKHQLDIFGADGILEYRPFSILKMIKFDGTNQNWITTSNSNWDIFKMLNKSDDGLSYSSPIMLIDLENNICTSAGFNFNSTGDVEEKLNEFWAYITQNKEMEGVVIKPNQVYIPGVAPYMKCRNKEYLRLTYGFDYDTLKVKYDKLVKSKSIKRKLETSIKEWELGRILLDIPFNEINVENKQWLGLIIQLLSEQEKEKELDPRL